jgi:hypothetical protein
VRRADLLLAGVATIAAVGGLELGLRGLLDANARAALPAVGASADEVNRRAWLGRRHDQNDGLRWDRSDELLGWRPLPDLHRRNYRPGVFDAMVSTNAAGLRGAGDVAETKAAGTMRIAVFGCSQTFGGVVNDDETFAARLQAALPGTEVLNFGVHGYGTDQMLLYWERDGTRFAPDVVVLAFAWYHAGRNVQGFRFFAKPRFVVDGPELQLAGVPVPTPEAVAAEPVEPLGVADQSVLLRWTWGRALAARERALYVESSPAWELSLRLIARFAESVRRTGARMVLVNIEEDLPSLEPSLARVAEDQGIAFVNAGPRLREVHANTMLRVSAEDGHFNAGAHRLLAELIGPALAVAPASRGAEAVRHGPNIQPIGAVPSGR